MGRKILVVDDEADMAALIAEFLTHAGYEVTTAEDGEKALELIAQDAPDLVLMDIILPRLDGWQVCQRLKADERLKKIPVILISGMLSTDAVADPFVEKCDYLIAKPFQMQNLLQKVHEFTYAAS